MEMGGGGGGVDCSMSMMLGPRGGGGSVCSRRDGGRPRGIPTEGTQGGGETRLRYTGGIPAKTRITTYRPRGTPLGRSHKEAGPTQQGNGTAITNKYLVSD